MILGCHLTKNKVQSDYQARKRAKKKKKKPGHSTYKQLACLLLTRAKITYSQYMLEMFQDSDISLGLFFFNGYTTH